LDDGCVLVDEDVFYGERRDFGEENAAEGVCDRSVDTSEGELGVVGDKFVEGDVEILKLWLVRSHVVFDVNLVAHTSLKYSKSHSWFSPGQCPGKSVDCWLVTVSGPTPSV